jgi:hypothetical protein
MSEVMDVSDFTAPPVGIDSCPQCGTAGAVRASHHPSGTWLLTCASCEWHEVIARSSQDDTWVPVPSQDPEPQHTTVDPAPDGVSVFDLRP